MARLVPLLLVASCGIVHAAEPASVETVAWWPPAEVDAETGAILAKLKAAGDYRPVSLEPKTDSHYAQTPNEMGPFRHKRPFKEHFLRQLEFYGAGRSKPEPEHVDSVKIGFIGPIEPTVSVATGGRSHEEPLGQAMLQGAQLAIEAANEHGGYLKRSIPFELVVKNDNGLWGASGNEIIDMAYRDKVWAILGTIDGANTHIAIRVALKAEVLMVNSGDTDPTLVETNIPWIIRCIGDDRQQCYFLLDYIYRKLSLKRIGVIRASNRYGRFGVREVRDGSRRLGHPIAIEMAYQVGASDFSLHLERLNRSNIDGVVHWGDAADGARVLNQMRALGMEQPFFASDRCVSETFLEIAAKNAEGVVCGYPWDPTRKAPKYLAFCKAYEDRFGKRPDTYAAHGFDGMSMLIWATQVAGLNRTLIRDVLAYRRRPWDGVTGKIPFSAAQDDMGEVFLAIHRDGRWQFNSRHDLRLPRAEATDATLDEGGNGG